MSQRVVDIALFLILVGWVGWVRYDRLGHEISLPSLLIVLFLFLWISFRFKD